MYQFKKSKTLVLTGKKVVKYAKKNPKKWTLKIQKSKIVVLVLNQSPISAVFAIVRFAGDQKTALTGDSLYFAFDIY